MKSLRRLDGTCFVNAVISDVCDWIVLSILLITVLNFHVTLISEDLKMRLNLLLVSRTKICQ
jgi:hypothetical protein